VLEQGDKLPALTVTDDQGRSFNTKELLGKNLVLWFYPKDDTPG
jgi:peroxiredoxin Q/BCP